MAKGADDRELVIRSAVLPQDNYQNYRPDLRVDFWFSCGYCTITEAEAQAVEFHIDHYLPLASHPEKKAEYDNLIYSCSGCNRQKGKTPPFLPGREKEVFVLRPDRHVFSEHIELSPSETTRFQSKSEAGQYHIDVVKLNRTSLFRLRDIRARYYKNKEYIAHGVRELRGVRADNLPKKIQGFFHRTRGRFSTMPEDYDRALDQVLKNFAQSPLLPNPDFKEKTRPRRSALKSYKAIFPSTMD